MKLPLKIVAIDPGGAHVGWIEAYVGQGTVKILQVREYTPGEAVRRAEAVFNSASVVVIEKFSLYPDKAKTLIGSEMETSQLIGILKYLVTNNGPALQMQPASIKTPTISLMKHRGYTHQAVKSRAGGHAKDAETHMYCYAIKKKLL